jgi:hypothetical protein
MKSTRVSYNVPMYNVMQRLKRVYAFLSKSKMSKDRMSKNYDMVDFISPQPEISPLPPQGLGAHR